MVEQGVGVRMWRGRLAGSVAESLWSVPEHIREETTSRLDGKLADAARTSRRAGFRDSVGWLCYP